MRRSIVRVAPFQAGKVAAVLYFIMGLVGAVCLAVISLVTSGAGGAGIGVIIALPFIYALLGFIFVPLACWLYNVVAGWTGGIELSVEDTSST